MQQLSFLAPSGSASFPTLIEAHEPAAPCRTAPTEPVRARRTDPATSHKAAERASKFAGSQSARILEALTALGGTGTAESIGARCSLSVVQVDRRRKELVDAGKVRLARDDAGDLIERDGFNVWEAC